MLLCNILFELQLAIVTEERDKLRKFANLKNDKVGDGSASSNLVQVAFLSSFVIILIIFLCHLFDPLMHAGS